MKKAIQISGYTPDSNVQLIKDSEILFRHLLSNFRDAFNHFWPTFLQYYAGLFTSVHKRIYYAKSHALIDAVIAARVAEIPADLIFQCYRRFILTDLSSLEKVRLNTPDPKYFWKIIRNCRHFGIAETVVHKNCDPHADLEKARLETHYELLRLEVKTKAIRSTSPELSHDGSDSSAHIQVQMPLENSSISHQQIGETDLPLTLKRSPSLPSKELTTIERKSRLITTQLRKPKLCGAKKNIQFKPMTSH